MKTKLRKNLRRAVSVVLCAMMIMSLISAAAISSDALSYSGSSSYMSGKYYTALTNVTLTGNNRTDIVNIARSQNGYMEGNNADQLAGTTTNGSGNYTEFGRWYGLQDMWCAMFVSWCAKQAGIATSVVPKTASTVTALNYFINQGVAHTRASVAAGNYRPEAGDIIFFKSGRNSAITNHIGIVTSYSGSSISTIEGNTSSATVSTNGGCVRAKSYDISNTYIVYVCRPNYASDTAASANVEFDNVLYDYRYWPDADTRWGNKVIGSGSATVGTSSGITTATVKLAIQAGLHTANGFPVDNFVDLMNAVNGYTAAGSIYWDKAREKAGFTTVNANLMAESSTGVAFEDEKTQIINWILEGKHLALYVADSKGAKSWVAVDEAMTLSTGEIYIMAATTDLASNANVKVEDKYANIRRIACYTGGQIAYELIGSDDYRTWRKYDSRWKETNVGGNYDVYAKGDLIIASTKLAIQAGLKNSQLYNVNNAIADTKKGSNGGFSDAGNMYWADAASALGFDSYNANLLSEGNYSSTDYYETIKGYINAGKHLVIKVYDSAKGTDIWVAVDEGRTLSSGYIWVWRSNIDGVANGEKTGDNIYRLDTINANFKRVACFTGGKIKSAEDHFIYLTADFNNWAKNRPMTKRSDGKYEKIMYLPSGNYEFKILYDDYWYGGENAGSVINNTTSGAVNGWRFPGDGHNCTLAAIGGYYTFIVDYHDNDCYVFVNYSETPPQAGDVSAPDDDDADDYRKWNITDTRWMNKTLGTKNAMTMSTATAGYGDIYVAAAKLMISCGLSSPQTMDPAKMADLIRSHTESGMFDWDGLAAETALTKVNTSIIADGTHSSSGSDVAAIKNYISNNHYHIFIKIDDFSGGFGWALVDEARTLSAGEGELYVWLSKSTSSKGTSDNPVLLSSISQNFKRAAAFSGGSSPSQVNFSGSNATLSAGYTYNGMSEDITTGNYVPVGSVVTINAEPDAGYQYSSWTHGKTGDEVPTFNSSMLRFTAGSTATTITYNTTSKTCNINYSAESHFTYASGKPTTASPNSSVSFTINPDTDYKASVFIEDALGDAVSYTHSGNTYSFTMPATDATVSVEMNYEDYRTWSKSDLRWADTTLGTSSHKVSDSNAGMGDLVVAVTKLSKQAGSSVTDVNDAVTKLNAGGGLGSTGSLDWGGTVNSNLGFTAYHLYNTNGTASGKASEIIDGINSGKHYVIKIDGTLGWVAVDEKLTKQTGEIYIMRSGDNPDGNADIKLSDISSTFSNYAHFTGGTTPSYTTHTVTFTSSEHIGVTAFYSVGANSYAVTSGQSVPEGYTVRFRASALPDYEFDKWSCNVTPDQSDTAELVVTVSENITVSCSEKEKDSSDTVVPLKIKYCYKDYSPDLSDSYEYKGDEEGNSDYLVNKSIYSEETFSIAKADISNNTALQNKVGAAAPVINSDYFNYSVNASGTFTDKCEFSYAAEAYVVTVDMGRSVREYTVNINNDSSKTRTCHFQEKLELNASDYGSYTNPVWEIATSGVATPAVVAVGDTYSFRVIGNMDINVRSSTGSDPSSLEGASVVIPAYETTTTEDGTKKWIQNFYIQNFVKDNVEIVGAGVFYALYNRSTGNPTKSAVATSVNHLDEYALSFENSETKQSSSLLYNNKNTGLAYSYINFSTDNAKEYRDRILRSPEGSNYYHYIFSSSFDFNSSRDGYDYHVYSFYIYREGGTLKSAVAENYAAARYCGSAWPSVS